MTQLRRWNCEKKLGDVAFLNKNLERVGILANLFFFFVEIPPPPPPPHTHPPHTRTNTHQAFFRFIWLVFFSTEVILWRREGTWGVEKKKSSKGFETKNKNQS